ncbi:diphthine synthase [Methanobacterium alcaliphilum]|uniref:diphthine synthase n=1 Tax=Methanobacterium alcaliphilum TaxID=392018 RepID=UPI00200AB685|nr:diphthine synthase [Methanobacterium alcaliphilum]MCK9151263.1 diphthine synthase [Methanobacterium alcaliphilum]
MIYFIGLGLYDEKDISLKGLEALKNADVVYAEFYTAGLFGTTISAFEELLGRKVEILSREQVEEETVPLNDAETMDVAFLVAGDALIATTHTDMMMDAKKRGIETMVIHSSSILSAAPGISGLQAYKFGKVTTIPFSEENYFPHSPYLAIKTNQEYDAHTLVLLDIRAHEDRYMSANEGLEYLLKVESDRNESVITGDSLAIVIARAGSDKPRIRADKINNLLNEDFGGPLHCLIIPSKMHFMEAEYLVAMAGAPEEILDDN